MPTLSTGSSDVPAQTTGFALIELLAVIAVLLAVGLAFLPQASGFIAFREVFGTARTIVSLARLARESAIDYGTEASLNFNATSGWLAVETQTQLDSAAQSDAEEAVLQMKRQVSPMVTLEADAAENADAAEDADEDTSWSIDFHPDGTSSGGEITVLGRRNRSCIVEIDKITGKASLSEVEAEADS